MPNPLYILESSLLITPGKVRIKIYNRGTYTIHPRLSCIKILNKQLVRYSDLPHSDFLRAIYTSFKWAFVSPNFNLLWFYRKTP